MILCKVCSEAIEPGEERYPVVTEKRTRAVHGRCAVGRTAEVLNEGDSIHVPDTTIFFKLQADDLPEWVAAAFHAGALREGKIGEVELRRDGAIVFNEVGQDAL